MYLEKTHSKRVVRDRHGRLGIMEGLLPQGALYKYRKGDSSATQYVNAHEFEEAEDAEEAYQEYRREGAGERGQRGQETQRQRSRSPSVGEKPPPHHPIQTPSTAAVTDYSRQFRASSNAESSCQSSSHEPTRIATPLSPRRSRSRSRGCRSQSQGRRDDPCAGPAAPAPEGGSDKKKEEGRH